MTARALMILGTGSHVGKSLTTAALCRILARAGYRVAPFKAQNMSLNSAATPEGDEIGRAQALQAEAAGIPPSVHMNPILIKPTAESCSQIVVRGKVWQNLNARTYHERRANTLLPIVEESYCQLAANHDVVVLEGAGSPAEINLKGGDIVNLRMAKLANAPCLLVGDIDRGGVFASLLGTCELLDEAERRFIRGFVINKFRGDLSLLMPGVRMMEKRLQIPCFGVVPYIKGLTLDEEDSVDFQNRAVAAWNSPQIGSDKLHIGVIAFPSISNFTDFDPLMAEPAVSFRYLRDSAELASAGIVILPGSKQTVSDLRWLRTRGFEPALRRHLDRGGLIVGICGGFQMLGEEICDPHGVESYGTEQGLSLLPIRTVMALDKVTVPSTGTIERFALFGADSGQVGVRGYEIHMGETEYLSDAPTFASLARSTKPSGGVMDGCISPDRQIIGTYLHGLFDHDAFRHAFLRAASAALRLRAPAELTAWKAIRVQQLDGLADTFAQALDLNAIFKLLDLPRTAAPSGGVRS